MINNFLKLGLLMTVMISQSPVIAQTARPNIIVSLVDDMGWVDTSVPFGDSSMPLNKRYHTPDMERLAGKGQNLPTHMQHLFAPLRERVC